MSDTRPRGERLVLTIATALMWVPCILVLIVGAPLLVAVILATSAGTMTVQVAGTSAVMPKQSPGRIGRWCARVSRS